MAFALALSKFVSSGEALVAPGAVITAEGQAMVRVLGATAAGVMPSTGSTATEVFCGFAIAGTSAAPYPELYTNKVETFIAPTTGTLTLQFTPVNGQEFVFDNTSGVLLNYTVTGKNININTAVAGDTVSVTYKYAMTTVQRQAMQGNTQPGGYAGAYVNQIGLVKRGLVYTSEFDVSVNWAAATAIKVGPNGQLTDQTGTGAAISAVVTSLPSVDYPFLGLEFSTI